MHTATPEQHREMEDKFVTPWQTHLFKQEGAPDEHCWANVLQPRIAGPRFSVNLHTLDTQQSHKSQQTAGLLVSDSQPSLAGSVRD
jgi:hypothetical protein